MASNSGGGFSKEQLALAKKLQSGYVTSGTFHSQGQGGSKGSSSPAARMPHATHPVRSQPPQLRSANGLVRPLPGNATRPASLATGRPAPPVQPSATRPAPAPTYTTVPPHLRASVQAARPAAQTAQPSAQSTTQSTSTGPPPPVHMPANNLSYTRPPPMPTNLQPAMTPTPMFTTAPETTTVTSAAPATANSAFNTASAPRTIQQSPNAQLLETVSAFQLQTQPETQTESHENTAPAFVGLRDDAVAKAIMQGIKINQSGKPIVWNWTSEEPVARELTDVEIEQMKKAEPLPPMIYDRPFHENATMKAPGLENKPKAAEAPRKVIGLKGSRHNW